MQGHKFEFELNDLIKQLFISGGCPTRHQKFDQIIHLNRSLTSYYSTQNHPTRKRRNQSNTWEIIQLGERVISYSHKNNVAVLRNKRLNELFILM